MTLLHLGDTHGDGLESRVVHGIELLQSCHSNFVNVSLL